MYQNLIKKQIKNVSSEISRTYIRTEYHGKCDFCEEEIIISERVFNSKFKVRGDKHVFCSVKCAGKHRQKLLEDILKEKYGKDIIDKILKLYAKEHSANGIMKILGLETRNNVYKVLKHHVVQMRDANDSIYRTHQMNEECFKNIDTEDKAYWLGFLWADGNVNQQREAITLHLAQKDKERLEELKKFYKTSANIRDYEADKETENGKIVHCFLSSLTIHSVKVARDLISCGLFPDKSHVGGTPKNIPSDLMRHFFRGLFDGDGGPKEGFRIALTCHDDTIEFAKKFFEDVLGCTKVKKGKKKKDRPSSSISYGSKRDMLEIYNFFYRDATIWMPRKKEKYEGLLKEKGIL